MQAGYPSFRLFIEAGYLLVFQRKRHHLAQKGGSLCFGKAEIVGPDFYQVGAGAKAVER